MLYGVSYIPSDPCVLEFLIEALSKQPEWEEMVNGLTEPLVTLIYHCITWGEERYIHTVDQLCTRVSQGQFSCTVYSGSSTKTRPGATSGRHRPAA